MNVLRALLPALFAVSMSMPAAAASIPLGGTTTVALNPDTVNVLVNDLGLTVAPIAPGTLDGFNAAFPITGAETDNGEITRIFHSGGLSLSTGGTTVGLSNFTIDLPLLTLFGQVSVNGVGDDELNLFNIAADLGLSLTNEAAAALNAVFGISALQGGIPIGVASVDPQAVPEPSLMVLLGVGLMGAAGLRRRARN